MRCEKGKSVEPFVKRLLSRLTEFMQAEQSRESGEADSD